MSMRGRDGKHSMPRRKLEGQKTIERRVQWEEKTKSDERETEENEVVRASFCPTTSGHKR